jgi:hypothetical protein
MIEGYKILQKSFGLEGAGLRRLQSHISADGLRSTLVGERLGRPEWRMRKPQKLKFWW